jgi:glutamate/tyrosine decarboxylase-like PLP-dependent enzyme
MKFDLSTEQRVETWDLLVEKLENFYANPYNRRVSPSLDALEIMNFVDDLSQKLDSRSAIEHVIEGLEKYSAHTSHPMYFGLFNPRSNFASIAADLITAVYNPQLAAWSHSPFAAEVEKKLIQVFGEKFGYKSQSIDGIFTSGGAEANHTSVLCALVHKYPNFTKEGLQCVEKKPLVYCSPESHHSIAKAVKVSGLGLDAVRDIPLDQKRQVQIELLEKLIKDDIEKGYDPMMIVATMGSTGAGIIDPIRELSNLAKKYAIWLHADGAYGGAVILSSKHKHLIGGIELADSITFDAHKWMSVTMSGSMFITQHIDILDKTFGIEADYMPKEAGDLKITDAFSHSIQWSRRFIGLKVYLSLLIYGWEGYEEIIDNQFKMGYLLKNNLKANNWQIFNNTDLPVVCFGKNDFIDDDSRALHICNNIVQSGNAWISVYKFGQVNTLRACITNYLTEDNDVNNLIKLLNREN